MADKSALMRGGADNVCLLWGLGGGGCLLQINCGSGRSLRIRCAGPTRLLSLTAATLKQSKGFKHVFICNPRALDARLRCFPGVFCGIGGILSWLDGFL